jgi:hypothetical protein
VEIWKTNDLRWLLDEEVLPENYDTEYLIPVLDKIIFEDEELTGNKYYTNFLRKSDFGAKDAAKLIVLRGCYTLLQCGYKEQALNLLKQVKVKADSLDKVDFEMKRLTQQLQVRAMKDAGKKKEALSFGAMCANIKTQLPNADPRNATVAEFRGYENIIKAKAA